MSLRRSQRGGILMRLVALLFLIAFFSFLYLIRHPLLRLAGGWWVVEDPVAHADAIVVIGDDNFAGDRASRASELYRAGDAPVIVASGRMLRPYTSIAELIERDLINRGVPATAIVRFTHQADDTRDEALALRTLMAQRNWHHILLVTSNYHTRRARYIFRKVFPSNVAVSVVAARDFDFDADNWWRTRGGAKRFFLETVGYFLAMWELRGTRSSAAPAQILPPALRQFAPE